MKEFKRQNIYFSLCGLNCGLCAMRLGGHCPGCGGGPHHTCAIARCSLKHKNVAYCFMCGEFPCAQYEEADKFDSFITHYNQFKDIQKAKDMGIEAYTQEQIEKVQILDYLLENYNAGRQKAFFCIAVNLLEIQDIKKIMEKIALNPDIDSMAIKNKAALVVSEFQAVAKEQGISLKLRKKPKL